MKAGERRHARERASPRGAWRIAGHGREREGVRRFAHVVKYLIIKDNTKF